VNLIQIPSTLLAQVDAAIGGKTGINFQGAKNNIGAFYQPNLVLIDIDLLSSLGEAEIAEGMAEIIKHSLIANKSLFEELEKKIINKIAGDKESLIQIIYESSLIKSSIVSNDEKELGDRALLNFGHTYGHAFESAMALEGFSHGQAVGLGMVCASNLSFLMKKISKNEFDRIKKLIKSAGLPTKLPKNFKYSDFREAMSRDKKILSNKLRFIILNSVGRAEISNEVDENLLKESLKI
jgi:3-dehydroquinate synthase